MGWPGYVCIPFPLPPPSLPTKVHTINIHDFDYFFSFFLSFFFFFFGGGRGVYEFAPPPSSSSNLAFPPLSTYSPALLMDHGNDGAVRTEIFLISLFFPLGRAGVEVRNI